MGSSPWTLDKSLLFLGTFVHSKTREELEFLHDAAVAVDKQGQIVGVKAGCGSVTAAKEQLLEALGLREEDVEVCSCGEGQFFFPGFIDTHVHAPQYPNVGIFGKSTLLDWLQKYTFPLEASLKDLDKARRVYAACVRRTLAHGTTTAAYFATIDVAATNLLADLCLALGQRALIGRVCMDAPGINPDYYRDESAEASLRATRETVEHVRRVDDGRGIVSPILTPRFAPSCSSELMTGLASMQRELDLPVQTHISELADDVKLATSLFPLAGSYAKIYDDHGLLTPRTILAHAVRLTDGEATLLAARQAKVAHCPCSNGCLTSGKARVRWLWDCGIDVGLGTDMSGGFSPSVLDAARQAALASRFVAMDLVGDACERSKLTVEEVLYLATVGGAHVVGLGGGLGRFEVGMQWDAQLIGLNVVPRNDGLDDGDKASLTRDAGNVDLFGWETWEDIMAKWLYNGDDRNTKRVWVRGRLVHSRP
ncbi:hypothetical protein CDD80_2238 [Ophiocordyceps camponoti-rufipedis]|uniref:Probable guanine deaminase n=1 Tax=Ophiocordyceps camponoti-rufipedis TaxID=2004952 RepID=A0A2C5Z6G8_9HYPO|nr:hypothetical protein CDD80_2238 [Ophiocordyceps camponoti-rufipedis]